MNLDDVIPNPQHRLRHSRVVGAPPSAVGMSWPAWDAFRTVGDRGGIVGVRDQLSDELGGLRWRITI